MGILNYNKMKLILEIIILSCLFAIIQSPNCHVNSASTRTCADDGCISTDEGDGLKCNKCDTSSNTILKTDTYKADFSLTNNTDHGVCVDSCGDGHFEYGDPKICMKCSDEYKKCKSSSGTTIEAAEGSESDVCAENHVLKDKKCEMGGRFLAFNVLAIFALINLVVRI